MLAAKGLHKIYKNGAKELHVLKGIDFEVEKGSFVSVQGASGAGKTTLLHLLGGLDRPTKGQVILDRHDLYKLGDKERASLRNKKIGFVFQFYHLLADFTALENVMLPAMIKGAENKKTIREHAQKILSDLGLADRVGHKPSQLSGGEQQRVAIARALVNEPEILFCDEPTGNLDSKTGEEICDLLCNLSKEKGRTVVIVTHEKSIAQRAEKIYNIKDGVLSNEAHPPK